MRTFNSKRLYKLTRGAVIVIASLFLVASLFRFYNINYGIYSDIDRACSWTNTFEDKTYAVEALMQCRKDKILAYSVNEEEAWNYLTIAILLPILFFGLNKAYNYTFPKKHTK